VKCLISHRPADLHHVKTRGSGGTDDPWNLMPIARKYHTEVHAIGLTTFVKKYPQVLNWMLAHGWVFDEIKNKWTHYQGTT
jgi:hypothetical protein